MTKYGEVIQKSISGTFDGWYRIITEDSNGVVHDFHIPFSLSHGPDSFYVDFEWENVEHDFEEDGTENHEIIRCPEEFKEIAQENQQDIIRKANV